MYIRQAIKHVLIVDDKKIIKIINIVDDLLILYLLKRGRQLSRKPAEEIIRNEFFCSLSITNHHVTICRIAPDQKSTSNMAMKETIINGVVDNIGSLQPHTSPRAVAVANMVEDLFSYLLSAIRPVSLTAKALKTYGTRAG